MNNISYPLDINSDLPKLISSQLCPGKVFSVVGLNDPDISFAFCKIKDFFLARDGENASVCSVMRGMNLFPHATVQENIFLKNEFPHRWRNKAVNEACQKLFAHFNIAIDPKETIEFLPADDCKIIEVLRAYVHNPKVLILYDTLSLFGYSYSIICNKIISEMLEKGCIVVYLSTKWETVLSLGDTISIVYREQFLNQLYTKESLRTNQQQFIGLLAGLQPSAPASYENDSVTNALNSLYSSSQLFIKNYEIEKSINQLLNGIQSSLSAVNCCLYLYNEDKSIDTYSSHNSSDNNLLKEEFVRLFLKNEHDVKNFQLNSAKDLELFDHTPDNAAFMILAPVRSNSETYGILQLMYKTTTVYSREQMIVLDTFCNEVAIIIESSRLMNQSILLRESHHRIKNNLQIIIGMLYMQNSILKKQIMNYPIDNKQTLLRDISNSTESIVTRIKSISMIHDLLANSAHGGNVVELDCLIFELVQFYRGYEGLRIETHIENIHIVYNHATSIAMIVNELINNCIKHAFINCTEKIIKIECCTDENNVYFSVHDNGVGLPNDYDFKASGGMGMSIIYSLTTNMNGKIEYENRCGSHINIILPKKKVCSGIFLNHM